ncbi:MAG: APC family permease [Candidatus Eremiobacteraeota bacterium]|nr:APC family permease [Candidatus Eremiobacteraeota bacterium]MBV8583731.1 APC family permease [Candidatus Eremiobacteraeota bacterium]
MIRGIDLRGAVSVNMITMIGIGPLITLALVLSYLNGPLALIGWIAGALVSMCDGLVWAELGSRYPGSGGTYVYLREIFGRNGVGKMLAFLFNWQFVFYATLLIASGYIGFSSYAAYLFPAVGSSTLAHNALAVGMGIVTMVLVYRKITVAEKLGFVFFIAAVGTLLLIILAGFSHPNFHQAFHLDKPVAFGVGFLAGLGQAMVITMYDYAGYSQSALMGDEVIDPVKTIPRSIIISIIVLAALYVLLQLAVNAVVPWQSLAADPNSSSAQFVAATVVSQNWGPMAAKFVAFMILVTAFASAYGSLLGFARIPYAAAVDGEFLKPFAKLHPTGRFPYVSVLVIGLLTLPAACLPLTDVINWLTAGIVLIQSIAQIFALFVMRARGDMPPFRMWLFPLPPLVALVGWILLFVSTGARAIVFGIATLALGAIVYLITASTQRVWPFARSSHSGGDAPA